MDPLLKAADVVTDRGDALFNGDCHDLYIVHTEPIEPGWVYGNRSFTARIIRSATKEEYLQRCAHLPKLVGIDRYFFHLAKVL